MTENSALAEKLRAHIAAHGPMTFRDFMTAALYDVEHGYYASGRAQIGRHGDFFTNVSVGPLFGQMLTMQFEEMWERLGRPQKFCIVEQGAGGGDFARDVLQFAAGDFRDALFYQIVEPLPALRERQQKTLHGYEEKVARHESLAQLPPFCGVHFSNELPDAFPVHLVRFTNGEWHERCIDADLRMIDCAIANETLLTRIAQLPLPHIENYETEISLDALAWMDALAEKITQGFVLTIDYGWPRELFYTPERTRGTISCYAQHHRVLDPLKNPGATDITAHVDFTSLAERALAHDFQLTGFCDQHHFFVAIARHFFATTPPDAKQARALQTLIHPQFLGSSFKVLGLQKGVALTAPLRGFEFARAARAELGIPATA